MKLTEGACVPCRGGVPPLTKEEANALLPEVPGWRIVEKDGIPRLARELRFPDFRRALEFTVAVAELAEREGHHPDIHLAWGFVGIETWTHKIRGLHRNDFILAAKIDAICEATDRALSPGH